MHKTKTAFNKSNYKLIIFIISLIFLLSFLSITTVKAEELTCYFIDVGQGDAILLRLPNKETMVIDGGQNDKGTFLINFIKNKGITKIDYLIGTHPHADHIGGLDDIINNFFIGKIYMPKVNHTTKTFEDVLLAVKNKNKKITPAHANKIIIDKNNLKIKFLSPQNMKYDSLNNWSAVLKIKYGKTSFLFTGDIEKEVEQELIKNNYNLKSDLLKISHHGSSSSSSTAFLKKVSPSYAVISVGANNKYNHPDSKILHLLNKLNIQIYRTDKNGTITAVSNGSKIKINSTPIKSDNNSVQKLDVYLKLVDLKNELVIIKNTSDKKIDISNWSLLSVKGNQRYIFPEDTIIQPENILKIKSGRKAEKENNTLIWTKAYIWNNNGDTAKLYNEENILIDSYE